MGVSCGSFLLDSARRQVESPLKSLAARNVETVPEGSGQLGGRCSQSTISRERDQQLLLRGSLER